MYCKLVFCVCFTISGDARGHSSHPVAQAAPMVVTPEDFHQGWVAALHRCLRDTCQAARTRWTPTCKSQHVLPIWLALRCWQPMTEELQAAIVQHHWQTRFYQQLSPVIAFVEMVQLGQFIHSGSLVLTPSGWNEPIDSMEHDVFESWLLYFRMYVQGDEQLVAMATVGIETALEWKTQHDLMNQFGELEPSTTFVVFRDRGAWPGALDWKEYHQAAMPVWRAKRKCCSLLSEMAWYLAKRSLNAFALQRFGIEKSSRRQTGFYLERLTGHLWHLSSYPSGGDVDIADVVIHDFLELSGELVVLCATMRATCKDMAAFMAEWWATLKLLFCTPDLPGRRNTRNNAGYRQLHAWSILTKQLRAMAAGRTDLRNYYSALVNAAFRGA